MLAIFEGYRTYISLILLLIHQGLKVLGIDIPDERLSITIDVFFTVLAAIFRGLAKPKII